jgi:hypothetical protein
MSGDSAFAPNDRDYLETGRLEFHLDLTRDLESLWSGIGKDQRDKIKKLPRSGVSIIEGRTLGDLQGLALVREATHSKRAARDQGYDLDANPKLYEQLFEKLVSNGMGRLFLAKRDDAVIGALFFSSFNARAYSVFSGSTAEGYRLGAQGGVFWSAVQAFKSEGFTLMNRGGVPASAVEEGDPQHGIFGFKKRLGTTVVSCRSGEKVLIPMLDQLGQLRERLRQGPA